MKPLLGYLLLERHKTISKSSLEMQKTPLPESKVHLIQEDLLLSRPAED